MPHPFHRLGVAVVTQNGGIGGAGPRGACPRPPSLREAGAAARERPQPRRMTRCLPIVTALALRCAPRRGAWTIVTQRCHTPALGALAPYDDEPWRRACMPGCTPPAPRGSGGCSHGIHAPGRGGLGGAAHLEAGCRSSLALLANRLGLGVPATPSRRGAGRPAAGRWGSAEEAERGGEQASEGQGGCQQEGDQQEREEGAREAVRPVGGPGTAVAGEVGGGHVRSFLET